MSNAAPNYFPIRDNVGHVLTVGRILSGVEHGERRSAHFYEVIAVPNEFYVVVRKLAKQVESQNGKSAWVSAQPGRYEGEPMRVRARDEHAFVSSRFTTALWDGVPLICSWGL